MLLQTARSAARLGQLRSCLEVSSRLVAAPLARSGSNSVATRLRISLLPKSSKLAYTTTVARLEPAAAPTKKATRSSTAKPKGAKKTATKTKKATKAKKPKAKKTKNAKKAKKPAKKVKKVLTPEQKAEKKAKEKAKKERAAVAELKTLALKPPKVLASNAYLHFSLEQTRGAGAKLEEFTRANAARYKQLSPQQVEKYKQAAVDARVRTEREYADFIRKHSAAQIYQANQARAKLRRLARKTKPGSVVWPALKDGRQPKRALNAYAFYTISRHRSGDFAGQGLEIPEIGKTVGKEWKSMSASQRQPYEDQAAADRQRAAQEKSKFVA